MVLTDENLVKMPLMQRAMDALDAAKVQYIVFDKVSVEPTNKSFVEAADFAKQHGCDGFLSVGGGSVMDTAKAATI